MRWRCPRSRGARQTELRTSIHSNSFVTLSGSYCLSHDAAHATEATKNGLVSISAAHPELQRRTPRQSLENTEEVGSCPESAGVRHPVQRKLREPQEAPRVEHLQ